MALRLTVTDIGGADIILGGDLSGTASDAEVVGLLSHSLPSLATGYLNYNGTNWVFTAGTAIFTPGGDLSGTDTNQVVVGLQTHPISNATPTEGQFLIQGSTAWAPTSLSGDVSASATTPGLTTVLAVHGATAPVAGALTTGNVLQVSGASALSYGALNLAGGLNYVTGNLPVSNVAPGSDDQILCTSHTGSTTWFTPGGDVSFASNAFEVTGVLTHALPSLTTGYLNWTGSAWAFTAGSAVFTPGGDLTGTATNQYIQSISGASDAGGTVTLGATVTLTASAGAGGLSLGSWTGAATLPTGNLSWAGASGKTGSLVSGGAFTITGGAASTWSTLIGALTVDSAAALNLGAVNATSVVQGNTTNTTSLSMNVKSSGTITEVVGSTTVSSTGAVSGDFMYLGASGSTIEIIPTGITWAAGVASPTLQQSTLGSVAIPQSITVSPQLPSGGSGTAAQNTPGSFIVNVGVPGAVGTAGNEAFLQVQRGGVLQWQIGKQPGGSGYSIFSGDVTPSGTNHVITEGSGVTYLNSTSTSGTVQLSLGGVNHLTMGASAITFTLPTLQFAAAEASPTLSQLTSTTGNGQNLTIASQAPLNSGTNSPGNIILQTPSPISTGTPGYVQVQSGGTTFAQVGQAVNGSAYAYLWLGSASPSGTNYALGGNGSTVNLNAGANFYFNVASTSLLGFGTSGFQWVNSMANPNVSQLALASTSSGSGSAGLSMSITAQAGQAATGASNNGGTGGNLVLTSGQGGTSGSATNGIPGQVIAYYPTPLTSGALANEGFFSIQRGGTNIFQFGVNITIGAGYSSIWPAGESPTGSNAMLTASTVNLYINSPSTGGVINFGNGVLPSNAQSMTLSSSSLAFGIASLAWNKAVASPTLTQSAPTTDVATINLTISAQSAYASATTNIVGGNLNLTAGLGATSGSNYQSGNINLQLGSPLGTGSEAYVNVQRSGSTLVALGSVPTQPGYGAVFLGGVTPSASNAALYGTSGFTSVGSAGTTLNLEVAGNNQVVITNGAFTFQYNTVRYAEGSTPLFMQLSRTTDVATSSFTIQAQNADQASASITNYTGGSLYLTAGTGAVNNTGAVWTSGSINLGINAPNSGGTEAYVNVQRAGSTLVALGALVGTTSNGAIYMNGVTPSATNFLLTTNGTNLTLNAPAGSATILLESATTQVASFSGTTASIAGAVGGASGASAFRWQSTTQAITSGASNVLANTVYNSPHIKFTGTLTGSGTTITLPSTDGAFWILDFSGVTFASNSISLIVNGNTWGTTISAGAGQVLVYYSAGIARLAGTVLTQ
jgi:hypothetical protein